MADRLALLTARREWPDTYTAPEAKAWIAAMDAAEGVLFAAGLVDEFGYLLAATPAPLAHRHNPAECERCQNLYEQGREDECATLDAPLHEVEERVRGLADRHASDDWYPHGKTIAAVLAIIKEARP